MTLKRAHISGCGLSKDKRLPSGQKHKNINQALRISPEGFDCCQNPLSGARRVKQTCLGHVCSQSGEQAVPESCAESGRRVEDGPEIFKLSRPVHKPARAGRSCGVGMLRQVLYGCRAGPWSCRFLSARRRVEAQLPRDYPSDFCFAKITSPDTGRQATGG